MIYKGQNIDTSEGFIKKEKLKELGENFRQTDLLKMDQEVEKFKDFISYFQQNTIIGLLGPFGSGKSNFLEQTKIKLDKEKRVNFDAWKYPERQNLWENFILEFARSINQKEFDLAIKKIEGKQKESGKTLIKGLGNFVPGASELINYFLDTTPAKRTFQLQEILKDLIKKVEDPIINIIVEDIDRSGDEGVYFLETLNYFINEVFESTNKLIRVVVPIGDEIYGKNIDNYGKCIDVIYNFNYKNFNFENFVNYYFSDKIIKFPELRNQLTSLFKYLINNHGINIRKIKKILLSSNIRYLRLMEKFELQKENVDFRMCILVEISNYIKFDDKLNETFYHKACNSEKIDLFKGHLFYGIIATISLDNYEGHGIDIKDYMKASIGVPIFIKNSSSLYISIPNYVYSEDKYVEVSNSYFTY